MVDAATVLSEQRPILVEFLADVGLVEPGADLDLGAILPAFDQWLAGQVVAKEDVPYLASRLGAYISVYLMDVRGATVATPANRIVMSVPLDSARVREVEPYAIALACASRRPIEFAAVLRALWSADGR